jgi:hypothetical protein
MRTIATFLTLTALLAEAQTQINKTIPVKPGQTVSMHFDYPELIKVSTWDKNEIGITGEVSINAGENDDAFQLLTDNSGTIISIRNEIRNMRELPHRVTVVIDGQKIKFRDKTEWKKYQEEHGVKANMVNMGVDMDIELEIKVPRNMDTRVKSVYGMVEVRDFSAPLTVEATYGGVDAALTEQNIGELIAETNYGRIYSNLDFKPDKNNSKEGDFHLYVAAKLGTGPCCRLESQYGNVYLRKASK